VRKKLAIMRRLSVNYITNEKKLRNLTRYIISLTPVNYRIFMKRA